MADISYIKKTCSNKIIIENRTNDDINISNIGINKTIYLLNSNKVNVYIDSKINNIYIENCQDVNLYFVSVLNKLDVYKSKNIYFNCSGSIPVIVTENISLINGVIDKDILKSVNVFCMTTYEFNLFSSFHEKYITVKHGMFNDRFRTSYDDQYKPIVTNIKKNDLVF